MSYKSFCIAVALTGISGAALAQEQSVVSVITAEQASSCKLLGTVTGQKMAMGAGKQYNGALKGAQKKAQKLGGNAVVVKTTQFQGSMAAVIADAFQCELPKPAS